MKKTNFIILLVCILSLCLTSCVPSSDGLYIMKYFDVDPILDEGEETYFYGETGRVVIYAELYYPSGALKRRRESNPDNPYDVTYVKYTYYKETGEIIKIIEKQLETCEENGATLTTKVFDSQEKLLAHEIARYTIRENRLKNKIESTYYDSENNLVVSAKYEYDDNDVLLKTTIYDADGNLVS